MCSMFYRCNSRRSAPPLFRFLFAAALTLTSLSVFSADMNTWFREFKQSASDQALYKLLWSLPKGGDLHHHLSGAGYSEWWY
ncbi:MAG: hypothetical protein VYD53_09510, partial [Pseudomonadota bacterium]|nr:hypothetical protein [Pseudomonadota bacterium]